MKNVHMNLRIYYYESVDWNPSNIQYKYRFYKYQSGKNIYKYLQNSNISYHCNYYSWESYTSKINSNIYIDKTSRLYKQCVRVNCSRCYRLKRCIDFHLNGNHLFCKECIDTFTDFKCPICKEYPDLNVQLKFFKSMYHNIPSGSYFIFPIDRQFYRSNDSYKAIFKKLVGNYDNLKLYSNKFRNWLENWLDIELDRQEFKKYLYAASIYLRIISPPDFQLRLKFYYLDIFFIMKPYIISDSYNPYLCKIKYLFAYTNRYLKNTSSESNIK